MGSGSRRRRDRRTTLKKPPKEELEHLYLVRRIAVWKIGHEYGCSEGTVTKWLHEYKIPKRMRRTAKLPTIKDRPIRARRTNTCEILKDHAKQLKDDPERLSTDFLKTLIGVTCK